jgi:hypothetical protein
MIRHQVTITFRDEKAATFDCYDYPAVGTDWITLRIEPTETRFIPAQAVQDIVVKDSWSNGPTPTITAKSEISYPGTWPTASDLPANIS